MNKNITIILIVISILSAGIAAFADSVSELSDNQYDYEEDFEYMDDEDDMDDTDDSDDADDMDDTDDSDDDDVSSSGSVSGEVDYTPDPTRKPKIIFRPYKKLIQTTIPSTPKPSYPPAVYRSPAPTPTATPSPTPVVTVKPTPMPKRTPYMNIFDHPAFMWQYLPGEFGVNMLVSRAELACIFSGVLIDKYDAGIEYTVTYKDVKQDDPFRNYIGFISQYDLIPTENDETFEPNKFITRADFAVILAAIADDKKGYSDFIDVPDDYWAKEYIDKAVAQGWIAGTEDRLFYPDKCITRGEVAKILVTILGRDTDETLKMPNLPQFSDVPPSHWAYPYVMDSVVVR